MDTLVINEVRLIVEIPPSAESPFLTSIEEFTEFSIQGQTLAEYLLENKQTLAELAAEVSPSIEWSIVEGDVYIYINVVNFDNVADELAALMDAIVEMVGDGNFHQLCRGSTQKDIDVNFAAYGSSLPKYLN